MGLTIPLRTKRIMMWAEALTAHSSALTTATGTLTITIQIGPTESLQMVYRSGCDLVRM